MRWRGRGRKRQKQKGENRQRGTVRVHEEPVPDQRRGGSSSSAELACSVNMSPRLGCRKDLAIKMGLEDLYICRSSLMIHVRT